MEGHRLNDHLRFIIPSDFHEGRAIQRRIMEEVDKHHFNEDAVFAIKLALEEALINAIKHGNKLDRHKKVRIQCLVTDNEAESLSRMKVRALTAPPCLIRPPRKTSSAFTAAESC